MQRQEGETPPQTDGLPPQIKLLEVKNPPIEVHVNKPRLFSHVGAVCVLTQPAVRTHPSPSVNIRKHPITVSMQMSQEAARECQLK